MGTNNIGFLSRLRANKAMEVLHRAMEDPKFLAEHPEAKYEYDRLQAKVRGTVGTQALNLREHITGSDVAETRLGAASQAFNRIAGSKPGAPLRLARGIFRGYVKVTHAILRGEERLLGHQAEMAGFGKHLNNETTRLVGERIPLMKQMSSQMEDVIKGQVLHPEAQAHLSRQLIDWFGNWQKASPASKRILAVAPFWNWYANSLRFLYLTLPKNHPVKTSLLVTLEEATAQQRKLLGQGPDSVEKLQPSQQGGIQKGGKVYTQQYYTPQGTVGAPLETFAGLWLPELQDAYKAATGTNPFGETLKNAEKENHTDEEERLHAGGLALLETFIPPVRWAKEGGEGKASKIWNPVRTSAERTDVGPRLPKAETGPAEPNVYEPAGGVTEGQVYEK